MIIKVFGLISIIVFSHSQREAKLTKPCWNSQIISSIYPHFVFFHVNNLDSLSLTFNFCRRHCTEVLTSDSHHTEIYTYMDSVVKWQGWQLLCECHVTNYILDLPRFSGCAGHIHLNIQWKWVKEKRVRGEDCAILLPVLPLVLLWCDNWLSALVDWLPCRILP